MANRKFFIAKVNIHGNIFSQNLDELIKVHIPRVILNPEEIKINTWNWSFTDVANYVINDKNLIIGNVTKSKFKKQKFKDGGKTFLSVSENELAETAFFVYDPENELLVHQSNTSISAPEFRNFFTRLLSRDTYVGEVIINPIPIPYKIKDELKSYDKITRIAFHLIHPNPGKKEFNLYNQIIDGVQLKELDIDMKNKDGIDIYEDESTEQSNLNEVIEDGINLVEKGYGDIDINGYNETTIQGKRKPKKVKNIRKFKSSSSVRSIVVVDLDLDKTVDKIFNFMKDVLSKKV
ncbi:hypothetical protein ON064_00425 [Planococcus sp. A6]|uniref:hypothetical protein n=1 Tax=Planococcus sp. A6 TaxID=2992760 RepID=UPI00237B0670|nr:hypothetical protein [Planococcus sp. A6]MDE0581514.1 hypothetical protein [Planococcus sp. A6]